MLYRGHGWAVVATLAGCLLASSAHATSDPEEPVVIPNYPADPVVRPEDDESMSLRPFEMGVRFGPSFGWYMGAGHLELDFRAKLAENLQLVPAVRVAGGIGTDDRNYLEWGGELGLRVGRPRQVSGVGQFGVGALYLGEVRESGGISHVYAVPFGRMGGGIRLAGEGRFVWGVEGAARFGYAVHRNPGLVDDLTSVATDRSSFFGNLDLSIVLSF